MLSIFFLFMGIELCWASFQLNHPHQFILTFFASNLIILISLVILLGVVLRMIGRLRQGDPAAAADSPRLTPDSSHTSPERPPVLKSP
jgi:cytochrome b561